MTEEAAVTPAPAALDSFGATGRVPGNIVHNHFIFYRSIFCTQAFVD